MVIPPFLAYDQAMRYLAAITMLVLALALAQPVAAQSFKPDFCAGVYAYAGGDYATHPVALHLGGFPLVVGF